MKYFFSLIVLSVGFAISCSAQINQKAITNQSNMAMVSQRAVTDKGEIVILHSNGTWKYENATTIKNSEIKTNKASFKKDSKATFCVKSMKNKSQFWIDPKKWMFKKGNDTNGHEYKFRLKGTDVYGAAITERVKINKEYLTKIALQNAKEVSPDIKILNQEFRVVNGNKVIYMEMMGTIAGTKIKYIGYYYSDSSGTTQYITYTGANIADQYKIEIEKFLNGFSIQQ